MERLEEEEEDLRHQRYRVGLKIVLVLLHLRFRFLRLSTIKKCPHMLKLDHRELRIR